MRESGCVVCSKPTALVCQKCQTNYCGNSCQEQDWVNGRHPVLCRILVAINGDEIGQPITRSKRKRLEEEEERQKRLKSQQNVIERLITEGGRDVVYMIFQQLEPVDILWLCSISDTILEFADMPRYGPWSKEVQHQLTWFNYVTTELAEKYTWVLVNKWKSVSILEHLLHDQYEDENEKNFFYQDVVRLRLEFIRKELVNRSDRLKIRRLLEEIGRESEADEGVISSLIDYFKSRPESLGITVLYAAASHGNRDLVAKLLSLGVDPRERRYGALKGASSMGHLDVVKVILDDPRVDLSFARNEALQAAWGYVVRWNVVEFLLGFPNLDLKFVSATMLKSTLTEQKYHIFRALLTNPTFQIKHTSTSYIISELIERNQVELVQLWLAKFSINQNDANTSLLTAARWGKLKSVKVFLTFPDLEIYPALRVAIEGKRYLVVKYLLENTEVVPKPELLSIASGVEAFDVLAYLLQDPTLTKGLDKTEIDRFFQNF